MKFTDSEAKKIEHAVKFLLEVLDDDPTREGLAGTPERIVRFWDSFVNYDPGNVDVTFEVATVDQLVVLRGIRVWSMCEHHLLPFWADISVGYITRKRVLGASKLARVAYKYASRLQIQERLVAQIGKEISELADTPDVAVLAEGTHLCMTMRGVKTDARFVTSFLSGAFREVPACRAEFFSLARGGREWK